jgi:hypothetical protein
VTTDSAADRGSVDPDLLAAVAEVMSGPAEHGDQPMILEMFEGDGEYGVFTATNPTGFAPW